MSYRSYPVYVAGKHALTRRTKIIIGAIALGLVVAPPLLHAVRVDSDVMPAGTVIGAVDVGGLRSELARDAVARHARRVMARDITITVEGADNGTITTRGTELGAKPRIDEAFEAADRRGFLRTIAESYGFEREHRTPLTFRLDEKKVDGVVNRVRERAGTPPRGATVRVLGERLQVRSGAPGRGIDEKTLRAELPRLPEVVNLTPGPLPPPIDNHTAQEAKRRAEVLLNDPPVLAWELKRYTLAPAVIRRALRFTPRDGELEVALHPPALAQPVRQGLGGIVRSRRDARFVVNGTRVRVAADQPGRRIDLPKLATEAVKSPGQVVQVPVKMVPAKVKTAELRALNVREVVGEFTTEYACCEPRTQNIKRAAQILNGTIIPPNGTFDLNKALGKRTTQRGFVGAPQIENGQFTEAVGGGVSQVATTVYNAAFFGGMELVAHTPHEMYISRYPMGREATVSWGGPELVFRNDWPAGVYMRVTATDNAITVQLFSRTLKRRVETTTGEPFDRSDPEIIRTLDPSLPAGTEVVDQGVGAGGFTVNYTRKVYRGSTVKRDENWSWRYRPVNGRVRYGPAAPESPPLPSGSDPGSPSETPDAATPDGDAPTTNE